MKKEIAAAALLIALFAGALINISYLGGLIETLTDTLETSREYSRAEDYDAAERELRRAIEVWMASDGYTHIFIRHSEIDAASDAFYELLSDISAEGSYEKLLAHLSSIITMEHVTLGSIF